MDQTTPTQEQSSTFTKDLSYQIEQYTEKVPAVGYLGMALGSVVVSMAINLLTEKKSLANFVGMWAPTLMLIGIYNKISKLEGNELKSKDHLH